MELGQVIVFDGSSHNGVYDRVMTFKKLIDGEAVTGATAEMISSDMDKWSRVAYRELAMERIRAEHFPNYPSRMACLYTSRTLDTAKSWADFFSRMGRKVFSVVRLKVEGNIFNGDACGCFDGTGDGSDLEKALKYRENSVQNDNPVIETPADGTITVAEIVDRY